MMNSKKKKIGYLLIILAIILLILAVLFFLMPDKNPFKGLIDRIGQKSQEREKTPEDLFNEMLEEEKNKIVYTFDQDFEDGREWTEDDFKQMARPFAERFGSYSNQSDYGNIEDLERMMSSTMKKWADEYVANLRNNVKYSGEFYGIVTRSFLEPEISTFNPSSGKVEVMILTQREETSALAEAKIFDQKIKITFIKEGGEWLVDEATWQ